MGMKHFKAYTPSRRNMTVSTFEEVTRKTPEKAICKTVAEKQAEEIEQEKAKKAAKAKNTDSEIVNLLNFKKKHAYA